MIRNMIIKKWDISGSDLSPYFLSFRWCFTNGSWRSFINYIDIKLLYVLAKAQEVN